MTLSVHLCRLFDIIAGKASLAWAMMRRTADWMPRRPPHILLKQKAAGDGASEAQPVLKHGETW